MRVAIIEASGDAFAERLVLLEGDHFSPLAAYASSEPRLGMKANSQSPPASGLAALLGDLTEHRYQPQVGASGAHVDGCRFVPPIIDRARVLIAGSRRFPVAVPEAPVVAMLKFKSAFANPRSAIELPDISARWDVDAAVGVVVGKSAFRIGANQTHHHVAGFTLIADVTDRGRFEAEARTNNGLMSKNHRRASALGPIIWIPEQPDHEPGAVELRVNGELKQRFELADLLWRAADVLSAWSAAKLLPGDMLGLGPAILRAGPSEMPPAAIKPGDTIEVTCPQIGALRVSVKAAE
jgi:acylpyruvate hydrolase